MPTAKKAAAKADALKLLKADHAEVAEMFDKYESGRLPKARKATLAQKICAALTVHAQIEEEIFYPAAREAGGGVFPVGGDQLMHRREERDLRETVAVDALELCFFPGFRKIGQSCATFVFGTGGVERADPQSA